MGLNPDFRSLPVSFLEQEKSFFFIFYFKLVCVDLVIFVNVKRNKEPENKTGRLLVGVNRIKAPLEMGNGNDLADL